MALGDPYADVTALRERFAIPDTADDDRLQSALKAASRAVNQYTGRQFNRAEAASARDYDPISVTTLFVDDFWDTADLTIGGEAYDSAAYKLLPLNGIQDGEPGWPFWRICDRGTTGFEDTVTVEAKWGWAAVPDPVVEATLMLAAEIFKMKDAPFGVAGWNDFTGPIAVRDNPKVRALLSPFGRGRKLVA